MGLGKGGYNSFLGENFVFFRPLDWQIAVRLFIFRITTLTCSAAAPF